MSFSSPVDDDTAANTQSTEIDNLNPVVDEVEISPKDLDDESKINVRINKASGHYEEGIMVAQGVSARNKMSEDPEATKFETTETIDKYPDQVRQQEIPNVGGEIKLNHIQSTTSESTTTKGSMTPVPQYFEQQELVKHEVFPNRHDGL